MEKIRRLLSLALLILVMMMSQTAFAAGTVKISLQPSSVGVGDRAYLKIRVTNMSQQASQPASVPGFDIKYFALSMSGSSMQSDGKNTYSSSYQEYTVTLRAVKEGTYTFGPVSVGGVKSNTIKYTIGKQSVTPPAPKPVTNPYDPIHNPILSKAGGNELFLKVDANIRNPYEQQPVVYTVKLYTSYDGTQVLGSPSAPSFENCTYEVSDAVDHNMSIETLNGKSYQTAVLMRYIVFPTKTGKLTIKGNTLSFSVKQLLQYDDGSAFPINTYTREQIDAKVPDITLDVRALPESALPVNGVGDYKANVNFSKTALRQNQVATLKYTVTGSGNLNFVSLPDIASSLPPELKFVKSESKVVKKVTADNMTGSVEFTVTVIPLKVGKYEYPEQKFNFFNPVDGSFYVVKTPGTEFVVSDAKDSGEKTDDFTFNQKLQEVGELSHHPSYTNSDFIFYLIYIIPFVVLLVAMVVYRRNLRISADVVGLRRKKAGKDAKIRLKKSNVLMRKGKRQEFFAEMLTALWGYASAKLNIPIAELTRDNVSFALIDNGVAEPTVERFVSLIDNCEFARYTNSSDVDMKSVYTEALSVINAVEDSALRAKKSQES